MIWLIIAGVLILSFFALLAYSCVVVGARADSDRYKALMEASKMRKFECDKCHTEFEMQEEDILVKYKYGEKLLMRCPHCDKITKINIYS